MGVTQRQGLSAAQWSQYWRQDSITTFARRSNENYDGEFAAFWNAQFERLADRAKVVDLATGNGAVALLARQFSDRSGLDLDVLGLDYAEIDPVAALAAHADWLPALSRIEFHGGVRIEDSGLADSSVDLLTSQYGLEYATAGPALAEARRVLKAGGRLACVMHHSESSVVELAQEGLAQVRCCFDEEALDERVAALVERIGDVSLEDRKALKGDPAAERLRAELNACLARIGERAKAFRDAAGFIGVVAPTLLKVFGEYKDYPTARKIAYLRRARDAFESYRERMADLAGAALSPAAFDTLLTELAAAGLVLEQRGLLHYERDLMGWTLEAHKPD